MPSTIVLVVVVSFTIPYQCNDVDFVDKPMQKSVITVCLHCNFARLKNKHMGTNVATTGWLHWSRVSWHMP